MPSATASRKSLLLAVMRQMSVRMGLLPPTLTNSCVWIHPQELRLQRQGQLADLVDEERTRVGRR